MQLIIIFYTLLYYSHMKIKYLLTTLIVSIFLCVPVQAQEELETRHEISLSYGAIPNSTWIDIFSNVIPAVFGEKTDNSHYIGPIGLVYYYHTSPLVGVGAIAVFATNNEDAFHSDKLNSHRIRSYYTLMPAVKFNWLRKNHWGLYSKAAIGASLSHSSEEDYDDNGKLNGEKKNSNDVFFNFQATLIGVEAGSNQVRGFLELGIGEQGVILGGVRYKF